MKKNWESACLVGLGNHAITKIIPALEKNFAKDKISVVTRKNIDDYPNINKSLKINYFKTLEDSFAENNKNCLYYLATPPLLHFSQTKKILNRGFDVMVEKPSFITLDDLNEIIDICTKKDLLMIEAMMYFENKTTKFISEFLKNNIDNILKIETNFIIPKIPEGTFRTERNLYSSLLADIGCYPLSFLAENSINLSDLRISQFERNKNKIIYEFFLENKDFSFYSKVGLANFYENNIKIFQINNEYLEVNPFYYGREKDIKVKRIAEGSYKEEFIFEKNAYVTLLSKSRNYWERKKNNHFTKLKNVVNNLQRIALEIDMDLR